MESKQKKEVEKKFRLEDMSKESFIQRLQAMNAKFVNNKREVDTYFNVAGRDSLTTKECLRVREADTYTEITYKPPTKDHQVIQSHFAKKETNVSVKDGAEAVTLLELLGNDILVIVDKEREYYTFDGCVIALDFIKNVGLFVEIEIETDDERSGLDKIDAIAQKLKLNESMIETLPYRDVVLNNQTKRG
jgi:adenylate cyclase class 2